MVNEEQSSTVQNPQELIAAFLNSKERRTILRRAVDCARNGIVITNPRLADNPIVYANPAFSEMTGYSLKEIVGTNCRFLQGDDSSQEELNILRKAVKEGQSCMTILRNYKKDGTLFWNELSIAPVFDEEGVLTNFIGVQNDITARKDAERRVSEFYSMVSHELRTPLTSIRASLDLVDDGSAGEIPFQAKRLLHIASKNAERLLKLVDDILDLRKMESGKMILKLKPLDADLLVKEALESVSQLAVTANIQLVQEIKYANKFQADQYRISQVLLNFIANAIKFSPPGCKVTVVVEECEGGVRFSVIDEGPGIAEEEQDKLFVKFQQLDSSDTRPQPGSGLGLAISKQIVELHGGSIGMESASGKGSRFWFILPTATKP